MTKETKMTKSRQVKTAQAEALAVFEAYKQTNETRLAAIEKRGKADPLLDEKLEKLARIDKRLEALSLKSARADLATDEPLNVEHSGAWNRYIRSGDDSGIAGLDLKSLNSGTEDQGGYVAPPELDQLIEARLMAASPMRQIATVRQTSSGTFRKPIGLGVEARWASETEARTQTAADGLALVEFPAGELFAQPAATQTLLEDAFSDVDAWLADEVEAAFAAQESAAFISGDGVGKPRGLLSHEIVDEAAHEWGKIGAVQGDFSGPDASDRLIDLIYAPKSQFRANGRFVMNRRTVSEARKLKDSDGRYMWQPGTGGEAATLLGYGVTEVEDMPDIGAGNAAIAFGDFRRGYLIVDRVGTRVLRDPFSAKPFVLFYTTKRVGGGVQNFDAIKVMTF